MNFRNPTNFPFWFICLSFILGIFFSYRFEIPLYSVALLFVFEISFLWCFKHKIKSYLFITIASTIFICLGYLRYQVSRPKFQKNHIVNLNVSVKNQIIFTVLKKFKDSNKFHKYKVEINSINTKKSNGYGLLLVKKDSTNIPLLNAVNYAVIGNVEPLKPSNNPYGFDYVNYLKNQRITHLINYNNNQFIQLKYNSNNFTIKFRKLHQYLVNQLKKQKISANVFQFTSALVLGSKQDLNPKLSTDFINAGVIHILAISGLHIGIIYLFFSWIFSNSIFFKKSTIKSLLIIMLLWSFVWFTGGSNSAIRATTMLTCFEINKLLFRRQHPINSLFVSVFILLIIDPYILFSVGFQLSVTAVGSIIIGVSRLIEFWNPKSWFLSQLWKLTCVSFCAQIGLLPLCIYYFHQFSSLFLVANVPLMFVITPILLGAIGIIIWSGITTIPSSILFFYNFIVEKILSYTHWVASKHSFIFTDLHINEIQLISFYVVIGILMSLKYYPNIVKKTAFYLLLLFISLFYLEMHKQKKTEELWILKSYKNTIIAEINSSNINTYSHKKVSKMDVRYIIKPIEISLKKKSCYHFLQNSYSYKGYPVHIIKNNYSLPKNTNNSIVILTNSPKINLERLITNKKPRLIIATAANYPNMTAKWKSTCNELQVDFYDINKFGSLNLKEIITNF